MKKSRINPISKTKRSAKIRNKRLEPGHMCQFQFEGCTGEATESHELLSGAYTTTCKEYGFQKKTCRSCHNHWHTKLSKKTRYKLLAAYQLEFMKQMNWTRQKFIEVFERNFL